MDKNFSKLNTVREKFDNREKKERYKKNNLKIALLGISLATFLFLASSEKGLAKGGFDESPKANYKKENKKKAEVEHGFYKKLEVRKYSNKSKSYPLGSESERTFGNVYHCYPDGKGGYFAASIKWKKFGSTEELVNKPKITIKHISKEVSSGEAGDLAKKIKKKKLPTYSRTLNLSKGYSLVIPERDIKGDGKSAKDNKLAKVFEGTSILFEEGDFSFGLKKVEPKAEIKEKKIEKVRLSKEEKKEIKDKAEKARKERKAREAAEKKLYKAIPDGVKKIKELLSINPKIDDKGMYIYLEYKKGKKRKKIGLGFKPLTNFDKAGVEGFKSDTDFLYHKDIKGKITFNEKSLRRDISRKLLREDVINIVRFAEIQKTNIEKISSDQNFGKLGGRIAIKRGKKIGITFYNGKKIVVFENNVKGLKIVKTEKILKRDKETKEVVGSSIRTLIEITDEVGIVNKKSITFEEPIKK